MRVRIYRPNKSAMQSGRAGTDKWVAEFEPDARRSLDPLMGWTSTRDTRGQVRMTFDTVEEAVAFATRQGYPYKIEAPHDRAVQPKSYADNFRSDRPFPWTH